MILKGAVAVLSGSGRLNGVGAATARLLAKEGCNVMINCIRSKEQALVIVEQCKALGVDSDLVVGDITKQAVCQHIAEQVQIRWGRADILVNCVGSTKSVPYENLAGLDASDFANIMATNITAPFLMAQALRSLLIASGDAAIVNVSSVSGITGRGCSMAYSAAKGGENTLTLALAQALSPEVRVNAVCPSFIASSWWDGVYDGKANEYQARVNRIKGNNLLKKILTPMDVAQTILSIINSSVMTGELIRLDSGAHIGQANMRNINITQDSSLM